MTTSSRGGLVGREHHPASAAGQVFSRPIAGNLPGHAFLRDGRIDVYQTAEKRPSQQRERPHRIRTIDGVIAGRFCREVGRVSAIAERPLNCGLFTIQLRFIR